MARRATVFVRFQRLGYHNWPSAPDHRAYLRTKHFHTFFIEVRTPVRHDEREVEFHDLLFDVDRAWNVGAEDAEDCGPASCETMARHLGMELAEAYKRSFTVSVSEEGISGAEVTVEWEGSDASDSR